MPEPKPLVVHNPNNLPLANIANLKPTQGDLKYLTDEGYAGLEASIDKHGFIYPIAVWTDFEKNEKWLLDGHQRKRFLDRKYPNAQVPIIEIPAKNLQDAAEILLKITSQYGKITQEGLDAFIATYALPEAEIYQAVQFDALPLISKQEEPEPQEDEVPEVSSDPPISKLGEIYQLGKHRLMCGDSTDFGAVSDLMDGKQADMVFTDPPYGMFLDTDFSTIKGSMGSPDATHGTQGKKYDNVIGDHADFTPELITTIFDNFDYCREVFLFGADYYAELIPDKNGGSWCVWDKRKPSQEDAIGAEFELIWSKQKHKRRVLRHDWFGFLSSENTADARNRVHPTQKPITLLADVMGQWGNIGDVVVDLYGGSGSTLIACQQLDRICYMVELDPKYCDVIRKRYHKFVNNDVVDGWQDNTPAV